MGYQSEEIVKIASSDVISFSLWIELLNYFDVYCNQLDTPDLRILVDKSEECRVYLNDKILDKIEKKDVRPNICLYLEERIKNSRSDNQVPYLDDIVVITNDPVYDTL